MTSKVLPLAWELCKRSSLTMMRPALWGSAIAPHYYMRSATLHTAWGPSNVAITDRVAYCSTSSGCPLMTKILIVVCFVMFMGLIAAIGLTDRPAYHGSGSPVVEEYKHQSPYDPTKYRL